MSVLFLSCIARPRKDNSCYGNNSLLHPVLTLFRSKLALTLQPPHFFFHSSISPGVQLLRNPSSRTGFPPCRQLSVFLSPAVMLPFLFTTSRSCFLSWSRGGGGSQRTGSNLATVQTTKHDTIQECFGLILHHVCRRAKYQETGGLDYPVKF